MSRGGRGWRLAQRSLCEPEWLCLQLQLHLLPPVWPQVRGAGWAKGVGEGEGVPADLGAGFVMETLFLFPVLSFGYEAHALLVPGPQEGSWG